MVIEELKIAPMALDQANYDCALIDIMSDMNLTTDQILTVLKLLAEMKLEKEREIHIH